MASLNIDVDDFTCTQTIINGIADSPYHNGCLGYWTRIPIISSLTLCVLSFRVRLGTLGYASDFKNSKKSVSPYVSGFRFRFPPYGLLFGRSVLLQYLHHLFTPFCSDWTPWWPCQSLLYRPLQFIRACIACSQALHILYVLIKYLSSAFLYGTHGTV